MSAKILIIDDDPSAFETLKTLLFGEGYALQFAASGAQGLTQAQAWQPDVILCDVMMPGLDGIEVCRHIRADDRLGQVPIVLITALNDHAAKVSGLEAGADDFLTKPVDPLELRLRLRTITRLDRFRQLNEERLKAAEARRESEATFATVFQFVPASLIIVSPAGQIVDANDAACNLIGFSRAELLGKTVSEIGSVSEAVRQLGRSVLWAQGGAATNLEVQLRTHDGQLHDVLYSTSLITLAGTPHILVAGLDITKRKQAEEKLRESEEKYRGLMESLSSVVALIDADGKFLYMNEIAARALGAQPDDLTGQHMRDLFPEPAASTQLAAIRHVLETGQPLVNEDVTLLQGQPRWFHNSLQPIHGEDGRPVSVLLVSTDVHELKTVQQELLELNRTLEKRVMQRTRELSAANRSLTEANVRLTELDRLKTKFVADVSHELRTPVTSLSLNIDLLTHGKPEKRDHYILKLQEQMARLHTLINGILDISQLEHNLAEGGQDVIDLNAIVERVSVLEQPTAQAAGLTLTCSVADHALLVRARPDQLTRAITNLVSNAVKYTAAGSVRVQTYRQDGRVCVAVADTGRGIPADELPHIFERFYRGREISQLSIPGAGLGLAIVREIVEAHGGSVEVDSQSGAGSTFRLWLPGA